MIRSMDFSSKCSFAYPFCRNHLEIAFSIIFLELVNIANNTHFNMDIKPELFLKN